MPRVFIHHGHSFPRRKPYDHATRSSFFMEMAYRALELPCTAEEFGSPIVFPAGVRAVPGGSRPGAGRDRRGPVGEPVPAVPVLVRRDGSTVPEGRRGARRPPAAGPVISGFSGRPATVRGNGGRWRRPAGGAIATRSRRCGRPPGDCRARLAPVRTAGRARTAGNHPSGSAPVQRAHDGAADPRRTTRARAHGRRTAARAAAGRRGAARGGRAPRRCLRDPPRAWPRCRRTLRPSGCTRTR